MEKTNYCVNGKCTATFEQMPECKFYEKSCTEICAYLQENGCLELPTCIDVEADYDEGKETK